MRRPRGRHRAVRRIVGFALLAGLAVAAGCGSDEVADGTPLDRRPVLIATLPCENARQATSSGFVIADRTIVTVAHAIHGSRDFAVRDADGVWHRPEIVRLDLDRDLAILRAEGVRATALPVAPPRRVDAWRETEVTLLAGAASGTLDATVLRRVNLIVERVGDRSVTGERKGYEVALDIAPGDSGAALVDREQRLVGIVFAASTSRPDIAWATAADQIVDDPVPVEPWVCEPFGEAELDLRPPEPERLAG